MAPTTFSSSMSMTVTPFSYAHSATTVPMKSNASSLASTVIWSTKDSNRESIHLITKFQQFSRTSSPPKTLNSTLSHPISTNTMLLNMPFEPSKTIALQVWPPLTQTFLYPTGVGSYPKQNSPSSYFTHPGSTPNSLPMHNLKESLTSTRPLLPHLAPVSSYMRSPHNNEHGHPTALTAGMLVPPSTTTNTTAFGSPANDPNTSLTHSSSFQQSFAPQCSPIKMPQSELHQELSHALKQQHNNPVLQLTDPQLHALDQLSALFTTMALGVEPTMLNSSPPSQFNQRPDFPTHEPSPPAILQPCHNLCPCPPTTPYAAPITHADTGMSMEYCDLITDPTTKDIWLHSGANEFSHLTQGLPDKHVDPTNTIFFIPIDKVPPDK